MNVVRTAKELMLRGYFSPKPLLLLVSTLLFLAGCDPYPVIGPTCINPVDNFKLAVTTQVKASNSKWINTNITISDGDGIEMELLERNDAIPITLCGRHEYHTTSDGGREKITFTLNSRKETWTKSPSEIPAIRQDDAVYINIGQPNEKGGFAGNKWSDWGPVHGCDYPGSGGQPCDGGTGTGSEPWDDDYDIFSDENSACVYPEFDWTAAGKKCWHIYGTQTHYRINSNNNTGSSGATIYNLTPTAVAEGASIENLNATSRGLVIIDPVPRDGYLQFRMDDCPGCFDNNTGGYTLNISHYGCPQKNGNALVAYIGDSTPDDSTSPTWPSNFLSEHASGAYKKKDDSPPSGTLWLKIDDSDGDYSSDSNAGSYLISTKLMTNSCTVTADNPSCDPSSPNDIMSNTVEYLVNQIEGVLRNAQQDLFQGLAGTNGGRVGALVNFIRACLVLYIGIYGVAFAFGMIQSPQLDFIIRVIKVAIIIQLLGPDAWNFFNTYFFSLFTDGSKYLLYIFNNLFDTQNIYGTGEVWVNNMNAGWDLTDHSVNFDFIDRTVGQVFEGTFWIKLSGLLFAGPLGWLYIIAIILGMYIFIKGVIKAILAYVISLIALAMLIGVSPLFIIFILFNQTKDLFEAWVQQVVNYTLRPILIFAALTIFNFLMWAMLTRVMSYGVCWKCIFNIDLGLDFLPKLCVLYYYQPFTYDSFGEVSNNTMPVSFFAILSYLVVAALMAKFIPFMEELASSITGSTMKASLLAPASQVANDMKKPFGMDQKSIARRKKEKADTKAVAGIKRGMIADRTARAERPDRHAGGIGMAKFDAEQKTERQQELGQLKEDAASGGSVKDRAKALEDKLKGPLEKKIKDSEAGGAGMVDFGKKQQEGLQKELGDTGKTVSARGTIQEQAKALEGKLKDPLEKKIKDSEAGGAGMADFEKKQQQGREQERKQIGESGAAGGTIQEKSAALEKKFNGQKETESKQPPKKKSFKERVKGLIKSKQNRESSGGSKTSKLKDRTSTLTGKLKGFVKRKGTDSDS